MGTAKAALIADEGCAVNEQALAPAACRPRDHRLHCARNAFCKDHIIDKGLCMLRYLIALLVLCLSTPSFAQSASQATASAPLPASAFAALPAASSPALSVDGKKLAIGAPRPDGGLDIVITDLEGGKPVRVELREAQLNWLTFEEGGQLIAYVTHFMDDERFEYAHEVSRYYAINISDGSVRQLMSNEERGAYLIGGAQFMSHLDAVPNAVLLTTYDSQRGLGSWSVFRVDTRSGRSQVVAAGNERTSDWMVDAKGEPVARVDYDKRAELYTLYRKTGATWTSVLTQQGLHQGRISLSGMFANGDVAFRRTGPGLPDRFESFDPATGTVSSAIEAGDVPLRSLVLDDWNDQIVGVAFGGVSPDVIWIDPKLAQTDEGIRAALNGPVSIDSYDRSKTRFVATLQARDRPPVIYLFDAGANRLREVFKGMPGLVGATMGRRIVKEIEGANGVKEPLVVTLPPGERDPANAPAVMLLRYDSASLRDQSRFDWQVQFLASRGYVVIEALPEGLIGEKQVNRVEIFAEERARTQASIASALDAVAAEGWVDRNRVCILGEWYGLFHALEASANPRIGFRCVIGFDGVGDLILARDAILAAGWEGALENFDRWFGADRNQLRAMSPARTPFAEPRNVLLLTSERRSGATNRIGGNLGSLLRRANASVEEVVIKDGDFNLTRANAREQVLTRLEAFLATSIGGPK